MTNQTTNIPIQLTFRGAVSRGSAAYAVRKVEHVLERVPAVVQHAQVVITVGVNPAQEQPVRIEVGAIVAGQNVRAHVAAGTVTEAADLVVDRLQRRLDHTRQRPRSRLQRAHHEWRHGGLLPRSVPAPGATEGAEPRPVVKRKSFVLEPMTPDEAADEMELLDHDFFLFVDRDTGADALVHRRQDGSYGVLGPTADAVGPEGARPPVLTAAQAKERLELSGDRFVFYRDAPDSRPRVLYRQYDGCYGLLIAA